MALSALKTVLLTVFLLLILQVATAVSCFGPKLFIGAEAGLEGEMRYHLVSIYLHEKTGIDSVRVDLMEGQTALDAIAAQEIDLGFARVSATVETAAVAVLRLDTGLTLYSGTRPLNDLQFSTVGRVFTKLQKRIDPSSLELIRAKIKAGNLPAAAVREFMMQNDWI